MSYIKKFNSFKTNESSTDSLEHIKSSIEKQYGDSIFSSKITGDVLKINIEDCNIEPEVGSWVSKTEVSIMIEKELNDLYIVTIEGISGEYGCEDEDEDNGIEPEFDYNVQATDIEYRSKVRYSDILETVYECLDDYLKNN